MITLPPKFVAFDLETTGLVNTKDEIVEIGAVKFTIAVEKGKVVPKLISEFNMLVNPNMMMPEEASKVNHITDDMLKDAPPVGECLKKFTAFCGQGSILIAHNAPFDVGFLRVAYSKNPQYVPGNPAIDSLVVARTILPELENHKLGYMANLFMKRGEFTMKIDPAKMHRAVYDCEMLMEVFVALMRRRFKEKDWEMANIMASHDPFSTAAQSRFNVVEMEHAKG